MAIRSFDSITLIVSLIDRIIKIEARLGSAIVHVSVHSHVAYLNSFLFNVLNQLYCIKEKYLIISFLFFSFFI